MRLIFFWFDIIRNPTEAGTYNDWESNMTSSIILNVSTSVNEFNSAVFPAFWTEPNQESNKGQCVAVNRWKVSNYTIKTWKVIIPSIINSKKGMPGKNSLFRFCCF